MTARSDLRNASLCVLLCMAALLAAWPFSGLPFDDDWSWALTVKKLHETGHLVYNGWSSPTVIAQAYWALLWVKAFGFSFNVLRVSSLPMSAGAIAMCYALGRRAGLTPAMAVFATLLLGFSPVYMPLACTFMTDVPGLFFVLLSMYALVRACETASTGPAIAWVMFGAVMALVGGSSRQIVWIVPLVVLPYSAWLRRTDRGFAVVAIGAAMLVFAGAMAMQHWFAQQPYSMPDPPAISYFRAAFHHPLHLAWGIVFAVLTSVLLLMPIAPGLFGAWTQARAILAVGIFVVITAVLWKFHHWVEPWMGNIVTSSGTLGSIAIAGGRPEVVSTRLRKNISLAVIAVLATLLAWGIEWIIGRKLRTFTLAWNGFIKPADGRMGVPSIVLVSLALLVLELTRIVFDVAYDRHLLPVIPLLAILLLVCIQQRGETKMPAAAWAILIIYGLFAFACTQEVNALARARVVAIDRLKAKGIPDEQIQAGFEHDAWVQGIDAGHVNDARIKNPPDAFDKMHGLTPVMRVRYRLESEPTTVTQPTKEFGTVDYFSLLPPFHRRIFVDKFTDPWWLDERAATRPVEKSMLPPSLLEQYRR